jgi:PAS domain S-box-containing protein
LRDSEERMRAILETAVEGIITIDARGIVELMNPAAEKLFGYRAAEVIGKNVSLLMPAPYREEHDGYLDNYHRTGRKRIIGIGREVVARRKDGSVFPIDLSVSEVQLADRRLFTGFIRDITQRKSAEAALERSAEQRRMALDAADMGTWDYRFDTGEVFWDDRCRDMWGIEHGPSIHYDDAIALIHPDDQAGVQEAISAALGGLDEGAYHREFRVIWPDGSIHWIASHGRVYFEGDGDARKAMRFIGANRDISRRKRDEEKLAALAQTLAEKNKELETIVYVASHDLRSPLVNIQGFSRELAHACDRLRRILDADSSVPESEMHRLLMEDIPEALEYIQAGVVKIDTLLAGFLRYSRLGRAALKIERLNMNEIVAGIAQATEFQLKQAGAALEIGPLPDCLADATQINQVFSNLLDNAIKYLDPKRPGKITINGSLDNGRAAYEVRDNGIGIPRDHQAKVFEIFHRLNPSQSDGEGLGLTIAQRILERHNGKIRVESEPGHGTTFFVSLLAPAQAK